MTQKTDSLLAEITRLEQETIDHCNTLALKGQQQVKFRQREQAFNRSLTSALYDAATRGGCEVRVTCRNDAEATFAWGMLSMAVKRLGLLDEECHCWFQIELLNNSCILVKVEDKKG